MGLDLSLVLATAAFIGTIFSNIATIYTNAKIINQQREELRWKEQNATLLRAIQPLVQLYTQYEALVQNINRWDNPRIPDDELAITHAQIIGQVIAELLAVNDSELSEIAINRLTSYMSSGEKDSEDFKKWGNYQTRNRNAMQDALKRLGYLMQNAIKS